MHRVSPQSLRQSFRALLASDACYHCASVFDPMSARMAGDLGFEAGILGGSVASLEVLAAPDIAMITLSEFVEQAARIGRVATLPVIADADHGYGNALNVMRTVTELERNGIAALTIEDTILPARFGGKAVDLIGIDEAVGKLKAALEARIDPGLSLLARTNAGSGLDETIARVHAYQNAGVDGICLVGIEDIEHLEKIAAHIRLPIMLITYGNPKLNDQARLASLGVRILVTGHAAYYAALKATYDCLREQRRIATGELDAKQLVARYSEAEMYGAWVEQYLRVRS
ncbi:MAG TPA: oxaloacetate decarboxylase [Pseudomonas sp.]|nr:oxaloacetate decarboxylase [Pseudomonas sp.]